MSEKLPPQEAVRLLRSKGAQLEEWVLRRANDTHTDRQIWHLTADIAFVAQMLADHIEDTERHFD